VDEARADNVDSNAETRETMVVGKWIGRGRLGSGFHRLVLRALRAAAAIVPVLLLLLAAGGGALHAQEAPDTVLTEDLRTAPAQAPLVYIDCNRCDFAHIRREIQFVNHVRDPALAQIHVLITDQRTGAGGRQFTLFFSGRGPFLGIEPTLRYTSLPVNTPAEEREGLTRTLKLGLVPYLAQTPLAPQLRVSFHGESPGVAAPETDPWNAWTFEVYGGGNLNMDASQDSWNARYGFFADRVTEDWKIRLRPYFNNNVRIFRTDDEEIRSIQWRHGFDSYLIRSVGPHWGAGVFADYTTTTFDNLRHRVTLTPAVEYSIFPYEESTRRQITFSYRVGYQFADYFEETIYEQTEESLLNQSLNASIHFRQPWGSFWTNLRGSNFLHDMNHYRLTFNSSTSFRLMEGVSVNFGANLQRIHDQLSLPRGQASLEDILLQRRQLATSYRAWGEFGLSYQFGSIYSNVVNPRL
jgi:hypothetical protein